MLDRLIPAARCPLLAALVGATFLSIAGSGCGGGQGGSGGGSGGTAPGTAGTAGQTTTGTAGASATAGTTGTAGRGGATAGSAGSSNAGRGGTTGSAGRGGSGGTTNRPPPQAVLGMMSPGWNLGNSFDATPDETSWGNPTPNQALINGVHAAGFKTMRIPVTWTNHIGAGPAYTIDSAWMNKVKQTAQWGVDAGLYVFVNTHHEADGNGGWVTFPQPSSATSVAAEVTAVWTQIANALKALNSHLMFECFNEPNQAGGGNTPQAQADLNLYLEACVNAIRGTGGNNATRTIMIQPVGASPIQAGIQSMQMASIINDPNLVISLHTYYPTNFGLSETPYAWGSVADYTAMRDSIAQEIRVWLPSQAVFIGEWGSMGAQAAANRVAHAQAYAQDTTTAGLIPIWWDNGGSGSGSFSLFNRNTGAVSQPDIVNAIMTGVRNGLAAPNSWAAHP